MYSETRLNISAMFWQFHAVSTFFFNLAEKSLKPSSNLKMRSSVWKIGIFWKFYGPIANGSKFWLKSLCSPLLLWVFEKFQRNRKRYIQKIAKTEWKCHFIYYFQTFYRFKCFSGAQNTSITFKMDRMLCIQ